MLRGVNRQVIFEDDEDRLRFLEVLADCKEDSGFQLYAYCLMTNHIHLLIHEDQEPLGTIFRRIGSRYVYWYNRKYSRAGNLFQDRFKSENVENERYFLTVLRYIIQNPLKAGLETEPGTYPWSSYHEYANGREKITDIGFAADMFTSRDSLIEFLHQKNDDHFLDTDQFDRRITDQEAGELIIKLSGCTSLSEFQTLDRKKQTETLLGVYECNVSLRQLARLTGLSSMTVQRCIRK